MPSNSSGSPKGLPGYVERNQNPILRPPYTLGQENDNTHFVSTGFMLDADPKQLQRLVDEHLNRPLQGSKRFEIPQSEISQKVLMTFNNYRRSTGHRPDKGAGPSPEKFDIPYSEVCFMFLVISPSEASDSADSNAYEPFWFMPMVFIGPYLGKGAGGIPEAAILPIVEGREVYGFPKTHGQILYDEVGMGRGVKNAELRVMTPSRGWLAYKRAVRIECKPGGDELGIPEAVPDATTSFSHFVEHALPGATSSDDHAAELPSGRRLKFQWNSKLYGADLLSLKQFRDPRDVSSACYQVAMATPLTIEGSPLTPGLWFDHKITFTEPKPEIWRSYLGLKQRHYTIPKTGFCYSVSSWLSFGDPKASRVWEPRQSQPGRERARTRTPRRAPPYPPPPRV